MKSKFIIEKGFVFEIKPNGKYLIIMQKTMNLKELSAALQAFFSPAKVMILGAEDVNQFKLTELLEETNNKIIT